MESECPGCKQFTKTVLTDALNAVGDYVTLRAIPYGNAQMNHSKITCQHGHDECLGNKIMLCMMKQYPDWRTWFPPFKCMEESGKPPLNVTHKCLSAAGMNVEEVLSCARSEEGELLHLKAGKETTTLDPPHQFTPWVLIDGKPVGEKVMSLVSELCKKLPADLSSSIQACHPEFKEPSPSQLSSHHPQWCYPSLQ